MPEHLAVRPPVPPEEQQDRQHDGDDDALEHAEEDHAGARDQREQHRAAAHAPDACVRHLEVHQRQRRGDHHRGQRRLRQVGEQRVEEQQQQRDERGADDAGELALGAGLLGDGGARAAGGDREALEEARRRCWPHRCRPSPGSASTSSPRRAAKLADGGDRVGQRHERDADGGDEQRHDVAGLRPREARASGSPAAARRPWRRPPREVEHGRERRGADDGDQDGGDRAWSAAGSTSSTTSTPSADDAAVVVSVWSRPSNELLDLVDEAVGVGREAEQLRQLADDDRDRQAVHVPDLHLLREQVGDEPELAEPEPDLDRARRAARASRRARSPSPGSPPATSSGVIAAKISGEIDESGPSTSTREGPNSA